MLTFDAVLLGMREGKKFTRSTWTTPKTIFIMGDVIAEISREYGLSPWFFTQADILADDYMEVV